MAETFEAVLADYNLRAEAEHRQQRERRNASPGELLVARDQYLLEVGEEVGRFLQTLVIGRGAKHVVEVGTSYGYSTLFLADAARKVGGRVTTIELSAEKQAHARVQLGRAGLADHVDWQQGDALTVLEALDGPFDLVLLDLWKELYVPCLELIHPKLGEGGIIAADNMLRPETVRAEAERYRAAVRAKPGIETMLLPIGQGIELSCLRPATAL